MQSFIKIQTEHKHENQKIARIINLSRMKSGHIMFAVLLKYCSEEFKAETETLIL